MASIEIRTACPCCGNVETRWTYDIGSGPELSCHSCEMCWGAYGQPLTPYRSPLLNDPATGLHLDLWP